MRRSSCTTCKTTGGRCSFCYVCTCGEEFGKYITPVQLSPCAALENQDSTDKAREFTVRRQGGAIVTLQCSGSLMVSDIISRFAPDSAAMVYHGARLLRNDICIQSLDLDAGCSSLDIHEWLGGGGGGCSRIRPTDDVAVFGDSAVSANSHGLDRTMDQHTNATVTATEGQTSQLSRIIDEKKIELDTLQREKIELAAASAKEISSLRLQVVALETQLSQAANETSSRAGEAAEEKTRKAAGGNSEHEDGGNHECLDGGGGHKRKDAANHGNADVTTGFNAAADKMNTRAELQAHAPLSPLEETTADVSERQGSEDGILPIASKIQSRIVLFFNMRNASHVKTIFEQHMDAHTHLISRSALPGALQDLGIRLPAEESSVLFETCDVDENGGLDLPEFTKAVKVPGKVEQWADSLPLSRLLAHCLSFKEGDDPLREVSRLTSDELRAASSAFGESVQTILAGALGELGRCSDEMDRMAAESASDASSKFQTFKMSSGSVEDFHSGLHGRVGHPHPNLSKGMEEEHCVMAGCDDEFVSSNYGVRTTPRKEYDIATGRRACPPEDMLDKKGRKVRDVRPIAELKRLKLVQRAGLEDVEIVAVVLYTGPTFQVYNAILRQYPADVFELFHAGGNLFATTIHVLVSAVIRIARTTRLPAGLELFRGLGGLMALPDSFFRVDANGCRGYAEWGFLSTTSDKAVAVEYSGVAQGRPQAMVLRMRTGSIDRGACIAELSQYAGEREYLWVPCSFLEPDGEATLELAAHAPGGAPGGVVTVVPVRASANLKARTVGELRTQKRDMHVAAFRYQLAETARDLAHIAEEERAEDRLARDWTRVYDLEDWLSSGGRLEWLLPGMSDGTEVRFTAAGLLTRIVAQCETVLERHAALPPERYNDDEAFRHIVAEMLETRAAAVGTLRGYIENPGALIVTVMRTPITTWHRVFLSFLERTLPADGEARAAGAARLCRAMGAMQSSADEADAEGLTPLMRAAADGAGGRVLRCLVAARADVNAREAKLGRTALWHAAWFGHAEAVEALARLGGDVDATAEPGAFDTTPMWIAAQEGHTAVIEALGRLGADVNRAAKDGRTPVYAAAQMGQTAAIEALGRLGADVNQAEEGGWTPVHSAANGGHASAIEALGWLGADVNRANDAGDTPLRTATREGHAAAADALRRLGALL